jgi:drug/metabolite transporter (DMT)-like permease
LAPVLGPFFVTGIRVMLGALSLFGYAVLTRKKLSLSSHWPSLLILALLNCTIPLTLIAYAEIYLTASLGSILYATTPLTGALLGLLFLKERYHFLQYIGFLLGILGVIILVGWNALLITPQIKLAIAAILIATFCYAIGGVFAAHRFKQVAPFTIAFSQQFFTSLVLLPFVLCTMPKQMPSHGIILALLALGILSTGFAWVLYFNLIKNVGASKTLTVTYLIPVFGILWGVLFLKEHVTAMTLLGLSIIFLGIYLVYSKKFILARANTVSESKV